MVHLKLPAIGGEHQRGLWKLSSPATLAKPFDNPGCILIDFLILLHFSFFFQL